MDRRIALVLIVAVSCAFTAAAAPGASGEQQVIDYLDHTLDWYRHVTGLDDPANSSAEVIARTAVRQAARQALRLGFQFGRAEASRLAATAPPTTAPTTGPSTRLAQAAATATERIARIRAQLEDVNAQLASLPANAATSRPAVLAARRDKLIAELDLANARQDVLHTLTAFSAGGDSGANSLGGRIDQLQRSAPEAQADATAASTSTNPTTQPTAADAEAPHPDSTGIIGQITEMFALSRRLGEVSRLIDQTDHLREQNQKLRQPLRAELMDAIHRADALSTPTLDANADTAKLGAQRAELQALTERFRLLSASTIPLGEQAAFLDTTRDGLADWRSALTRQYTGLLRRVLVRLLGLAIAVAVVFGLSALWRHAAFKYVTDVRRRRQILLIRRIVVAVVLLIVGIVSFVSEIGSLATFAGIITAGIAVALQTFILSGVAYFFFIGRWGVKVGDRVTVGGITGEVLETGLFRLYLMELGGAGNLRPSGRIAVFSNSVLFQPSGFFKQPPGSDFVFHEVALTLSPESDHALAERRLMAAVNEALAEYRPELERQHGSAQSTSPLPMPVPKAEGRLHFVDAGLEYVIRYPIPLRHAAEADDRVTRQVLAAIEQEPKLKLVAAGTPKIQAAT